MKKLLALSFIFCFFVFSSPLLAAEPTEDWVIRKFETTINLQSNSTVLIKEDITADCGTLPNKHGIFRSIPAGINTSSGFIKMPIKMLSITDENNKKIPFTVSQDGFVKTWKIGDPDKTTSGTNIYQLTYQIKNVLNHLGANNDEFYWNILGPEWVLPINEFYAELLFPKNLEKNNVQVDSFYHNLTTEQIGNPEYSWVNEKTLTFSAQNLLPRQALTISLLFPQNLIAEYEFTFWEKYGRILPLLLPILIFIISFFIWKKFGDDQPDHRAIIAQYEPPTNLTLAEVSAIEHNGHFQKKSLIAEIFNLAVKGFVKIEIKDEKKYLFSKTEKQIDNLSVLEKEILQRLFAKENSFEFSSGYNKNLAELNKFSWNSEITKELKNKNILDPKFGSAFWLLLLSCFAIIGAGSLIFAQNEDKTSLIFGTTVSIVIFSFFAYYLKKLTPNGNDFLWQIKGFRLYMNTAEKYREQFNEKENIFEKFLPYAMLFGITKIWINKMKQLYGENYFNNYHPAWLIGSSLPNFNFDNFQTIVSDVNKSLNSAMTTSNGSGGSGFSGGGGGGGGGGGW